MAEYNYSELQNGSDIRGVAIAGVPGENVNLDETAVRRIAKAFLLWLKEKTGKDTGELTVSIGRDSRLSGGDLIETFSEAISPYGVTIYNCGLASTPAMFMSTLFENYRADGAVMLTASHLPYNRNGMKFFTSGGGLEKTDISAILNIAADDRRLAELKPTIEHFMNYANLMKDYSEHLRTLIQDAVGSEKPLAGLKIAVDAGNGAGGFFASSVLEPLGADVSASRYLDPDGNFPNHVPNPENKEAMASIREAVLEGGCDLGLIFDTDVDRSAAVDENGREIGRNGIVAMAAALIAEDNPGTFVVTDSITSNELTEFLENELHVKHFRYKRGYRNVINKSIELNAEGKDSQLAIETSGHCAFKDNYFLDDGAYLAAKIVVKTALLHKEGKNISSVIAGLREPEESLEIRMPLNADDFSAMGDRIIETLKIRITENDPAYTTGIPAEKVRITVVEPNYEGIRIAFSGDLNGWFLLRKSLHDPIMPLNIESENTGGCRKIAAVIRECLCDIPEIDISGL